MTVCIENRPECRPPLRIDIITVFPGMISGFTGESMMRRAAEMGRVKFNFVNPRDFASGSHRSTDDRPYGGGPGMVMLADPIMRAVETVALPESKLIMMTPSGRQFSQKDAHRLAKESHLVFICGHYEGIDDRVRQLLKPEEISIGDYVLTNGALSAAVVIDSVVRLLPGVLGGVGAAEDESFETGLLEYPQYTRPEEYRGLKVPEILRTGDHKAVAEWRRRKAEELTVERRPDLAAEIRSEGSVKLSETKTEKTKNCRHCRSGGTIFAKKRSLQTEDENPVIG